MVGPASPSAEGDKIPASPAPRSLVAHMRKKAQRPKQTALREYKKEVTRRRLEAAAAAEEDVKPMIPDSDDDNIVETGSRTRKLSTLTRARR